MYYVKLMMSKATELECPIEVKDLIFHIHSHSIHNKRF